MKNSVADYNRPPGTGDVIYFRQNRSSGWYEESRTKIHVFSIKKDEYDGTHVFLNNQHHTSFKSHFTLQQIIDHMEDSTGFDFISVDETGNIDLMLRRALIEHSLESGNKELFEAVTSDQWRKKIFHKV